MDYDYRTEKTEKRRKVSFTGLPKYDLVSIREFMRKHKTLDPEEALIKESIPYEHITREDYYKISNKQDIACFYVNEHLFKNLFMNGDKLIIYILKDERPCCASCTCQ
jgi:hypothetical protein